MNRPSGRITVIVYALVLAMIAATLSPAMASVSASGGFEHSTVVNGIEYRVHVFTNTGESDLTVHTGGEVEYLIVAGGGGGGSRYRTGGGGGAGGLRQGSIALTTDNSPYTIIVGAGGGGGGADGAGPGTNGNPSSAFGLAALGGGGGGVAGTNALNNTGRDGGSGGGGGTGTAGTGDGGGGGGAGEEGQGYGGGQAFFSSDTNRAGGGGGGAGGPGSNGSVTPSVGGAGGLGVESSITGGPVTYATGGRGGGAGNDPTTTASANANTGGGGGGTTETSTNPGGDGGSGIVVVRYPIGNLTSWPYRLPLTFNEPVGATLTNYPVLVQLSTNLAGFSYNQFDDPAAGSDLRFFAAGLETELPYEIEVWDNTGISYLWVRIPELTGTGETVYAAWGRAGLEAPAYRTNSTVWTEGFVGVWHLNEGVINRTVENIFKDSTANAFHGTDYVRPASIPSPVHLAVTFNSETNTTGFGDYIQIEHDSAFNFHDGSGDKPFTLSGWVYIDEGQRIRLINKAQTTGSQQISWRSWTTLNGAMALDLADESASPADRISVQSQTNIVPFNQWVYLSMSYDGSAEIAGIKLFKNGVQTENNLETSYKGDNYVRMRDNASTVDIGASLREAPNPAYRSFTDGSIDEVRVANVQRPSQWIRADYLTVASNDVFMTYGAIESDIDETLSVTAQTESGIGAVEVTVHGLLLQIGGEGADNPDVYVCWQAAPAPVGGSSTGDWTQVEFVGADWGTYGSFSHLLSPLEPGGEYSYAFYVTNNTGYAWSTTQSVTTIDYPAATADGVSDVTRYTVTLKGEVTADGGETPLAGFAWWPKSGGATSVETIGFQEVGVFSVPLTGLTSDTTYEFAAWASNTAGKVWSATNEWTTLDMTPRTYNWAGPDEGDWFTAVNWDPVGMPGGGLDTARLTNGIIRLTAATDELAAFEMTGGTLRFSGWETVLAATNITIEGGTVTHVNNTASEDPWVPNGRVYFTGGEFYLGSNATVNANARGYAGGSQAAGRGPGGGSLASTSGSNLSGAGGGYGGAGGTGSGGAAGGPVNGTAADPLLPGSGGGGRSTAGAGSSGGGAVRIAVSGLVTINGSIRANSGAAPGNYVGVGSGGAIRIDCDRFTGTGEVTANGLASGTYGGGGGGGRIAIVFDPASQATLPKPTVTFSALAGSGGFSTGGLGTLFLSGDTILDGAWLPHNAQIAITGWTNWVTEALHVTGWLRIIPSGATHLTLTVAGDMSINGSGAHLDFYRPILSVGGGLTVTNGAQLTVRAASTNASTPEYGALVSVTGQLAIGASSWIRPNSVNTNGGSVFMRAGSLAISGGGINADALGFRGKLSGGFSYTPGYEPLGPGAGGAATFDACGGGYGGRGGRGETATGRGTTNGIALRPVGPGSGGSGRNGTQSTTGGAGGGLIQLEIGGPAVVHGILTANGQTPTRADGHAGGSGGGIFLRCHDLTLGTTAILRANGGDSKRLDNDGGGGGGRIAVWYGAPYSSGLSESRFSYHDPNVIPDPFSAATITVNPGTGYTHADSAAQGTIRFVRVLKSGGTVFMVR